MGNVAYGILKIYFVFFIDNGLDYYFGKTKAKTNKNN